MKKIINSLAVFFFFALIGSIFVSPAHAAPPANFQVDQIITSGLNGPSGFEIAPDGRIFILERTGLIKVVKNGQLLPTPFANLPSVASGDRGLIGIAFDPEFGITNNYVYFYYTGTDLLNHLVRFDASSDVGQDGPYTLYQTNSPSQELHVGGSIRFGPDGKLYFAVGDNGYPPNAQNLSNPHGKILRINKDGSVPLDNPFYGQPGALPEIWAYGMRNPWRFQFDSATGEMYGGDVGDYTWEEVNHIRKGQNYGWPNFEGYCNTLCGTTTTPIFAYNHDNQSSAVTGGPVYRGDMFPATYKGSLFFGDYARGFIKRAVLDANGNASSIQDFDLNAGSVVDLKVASDGSMYYLTYFPGRLLRVSYTTGNHAPVANATSDVNKGNDPLTVHFSSAGSSDPDNDPVTYLWKFGDGTTSTAANPTKTYTNKGTYTVDLAVSDGTHTSNAVALVIQVGIPPTVTIGEPADGSTYRDGDTIHYTAAATDAAGFDMDDRDISTEVIFHHDTHIHPFLGPIIGRQSTFTIPTTGEPSPNTWYEIKVTATDKNGLSSTKSNFIYPIKSTYTLQTNPTGLKVLVDGVPHTAPDTIQGVVNFKRELNVPTTQTINGQEYQFTGWSDNQPQRHFITTQENPTTYTATFAQSNPFNAQYYNNTTLTGNPVLTRQDPTINFTWGDGSPAPAVNTDNFSVRWTKTQFFAAGTYTFSSATDDGLRLYVDNQLVIDNWNSGVMTNTATVPLTAGNHEIRMEYFDSGGGASAKLTWDLAPNQQTNGGSGFTTTYYNNRTLTGAPALSRNEDSINNDWGNGSPDPAVNADNFSARWTKTENFTAGTYRFTATADDGIRVKVDGETIIDKFIDQAPTTYTADKTLTVGEHTVVVEYYEAIGGAVAKVAYIKVADTPPADGYAAEYFTNTTLTGVPALKRTDAVVNFDWGGGSPDPTIPGDNYSARWTKTQTFTAGDYQFSVTGDDGIRLKIDGVTVLDQWKDQAPTTYQVTKTLTAGNHTIVLEYYEKSGGAVAKLSFATATAPPPTGGYNAEFFNNQTLTGAPVVSRTDADINYDWAGGSPDPLINANNFSARWTKTDAFAAGTYAFTVTADDGVRVKVDNETIIDQWKDEGPTTYTVNKALTAGNHTVVIEYYENAGGAVAKASYAKVNDTPPPPSTDKYQAKYWNLPAPVSKPAIPAGAATLAREDAVINFDWSGAVQRPDPTINTDGFVAQWIGTKTFEAATYKFTTVSDDGIRVFVDNEPVIDQWNDHGSTTFTGDKTLTAGDHIIRVEYYENTGGAVAQFNYAKVTDPGTPPQATGCPVNWLCQDIGGPNVAGSTAVANNIYTLKGSGTDIWNLDDMFHFASQAITGDATVIARITSQTNNHGWAKAGVMIKESLTKGSNYVLMSTTPGNGFRMQYNFNGETNGGAYTFPNAWVKLTRGGNTFKAYTSPDGTNWTQTGTTDLTMNQDARIGLFITSHDNNVLGTATFDNVSITPGVH